MPEIKEGDYVWVNEHTIGQKLLPHDWYGKVISIGNDIAKIKDTNKESSYFGQTFPRFVENLELKE